MVIHSQQGLDIPSISALYTESHSTSHTRTRLQGDSRINQVLDHTLAREGEYTRMQHITTQCEVTFREVLHLNTLQGEVPEFSGERAKQQAYNFNKDIQKKVRSSVRETEQKKQVEHAKSLTVQGRFLALADWSKRTLSGSQTCLT